MGGRQPAGLQRGHQQDHRVGPVLGAVSWPTSWALPIRRQVQGVGVFAAGPYVMRRAEQLHGLHVQRQHLQHGAGQHAKPHRHLERHTDRQQGQHRGQKVSCLWAPATPRWARTGDGAEDAVHQQRCERCQPDHVVRGASHTFLTDFDSTGSNSCGSVASPTSATAATTAPRPCCRSSMAR